MSSFHYLHLFDWSSASDARIRLGDEIFNPFTDLERNDDSIFLFEIEIELDRELNNLFGDYSFQGAPRWFDRITQEFAMRQDMRCLARARDALLPFLGPKHYICDLHPPPACSFVPTILSPEHAETIIGSLQDVDLAMLSESDLHSLTQRINPELQPTENPYFRNISDLSRYLDMYVGLFRQAIRERAGVVSYFD